MGVVLAVIAVVLLALGLTRAQGARSMDYLVASGCMAALAVWRLFPSLAWWGLGLALFVGAIRMWQKPGDLLGQRLVGGSIAAWALGWIAAYLPG